MKSVVRVFNPMGKPLAWLRASTLRSYMSTNWKESELGTCSFVISTGDEKCTMSNLQFGNILLVEDEDSELPPWVGFIDSDLTRTWKYGEVNVNAIAAEKILQWRVTYPMPIFGTPGQCYKQVIEWTNRTTPFGLKLKAGNIWDGGWSSHILTTGTMFEVVQKICKFAGGHQQNSDFSVSHKINAMGTLGLYCNLYKIRGIKTGIELTELNVKGMGESLIEQGEIWNYVSVYAPSATQGGRIVRSAWNEASIARYGLRHKAYQGIGTDPEGLQYQAENYVEKHKDPKRDEPVVLINHDHLYRSVRLGNTFKRRSTVSGFERGLLGYTSMVKLTSFEVDDRSKSVAGTLEVLGDN